MSKLEPTREQIMELAEVMAHRYAGRLVPEESVLAAWRTVARDVLEAAARLVDGWEGRANKRDISRRIREMKP